MLASDISRTSMPGKHRNQDPRGEVPEPRIWWLRAFRVPQFPQPPERNPRGEVLSPRTIFRLELNIFIYSLRKYASTEILS